jgi:hypothetical protein
MEFDLVPLFADIILQLSLDGTEGVTYGNIDIFVGMVLIGTATGNDLATGDRQVDTHMEQFALAVMLVRRLNHYATGHYVIAETVEFFGLLLNVGKQCIGSLHVTEGYL